MSTRANYEFYNGTKKLGTIYIHHDGYCKGAAEYFHKALIHGHGYINSVDCFYQANMDVAEWSPTIHGDIEYLYKFDVSTQMLKIYKVYDGKINKDYEVIEIHAFVNKFYYVFSHNKTLREYLLSSSLITSETSITTRVLYEARWFSTPVLYAIDSFAPRYTCLELLYKELDEVTKDIIAKAYTYGASNPNYKFLTQQAINRIGTITALIANQQTEAIDNTEEEFASYMAAAQKAVDSLDIDGANDLIDKASKSIQHLSDERILYLINKYQVDFKEMTAKEENDD